MSHTSKAPTGIFRLIVFSLLFAAALFLLHHAISLGLHRVKTSDYGVWNRVMNGQINADIVISGSSRALVHYNAPLIEKITGVSTYNIGLNGSQTDMQLAFLKSYLKHNAKPKLVVHNLDMHSFRVTRDPFNLVQFVPYLHEEAIYNSIKRYYPDVWKAKYLPLYGYVVEDMRFVWLQGLLALTGRQPKEDRFQGFAPRHSTWTAAFGKFRENNPEGVRFEIEPLGIKCLTELIELCHSEGIDLLFVYSPDYYEVHEMELNRGEILARFQSLGTQFNIPVWDYSNSPITRDHVNFYNSQHLNAEGADRFSADLAERLIHTTLLQKSLPINR